MNKLSKEELHFLILKIHSLTGIVPIGIFLVFHLGLNSLRTVGVLQYQISIDIINNLPFLFLIEVGFIYIPLLFHSLVGFYITFGGRPNVMRYRYPRNYLYTLQRISGAVVFLFLIYHMGTTVVPKMFYGKHHFLASPFLIDIMNTVFQTWLGRGLYFIGVFSATFHFANGLWGFCVSWGILMGPASQRNATILCLLLGLALTFLGLATIFEFSLHPIPVKPTISVS